MTTPQNVACCRPAIMDSTVDLPHPECPRIQTNSLSRILAFTFLTATQEPEGLSNTFVSPVISRVTIILVPRPPALWRRSSRLRAASCEQNRRETPRRRNEYVLRPDHVEAEHPSWVSRAAR